MKEDIAKRSIDWLRETGAGVLALMGGEPLLRPEFAHRVLLCCKERFLDLCPDQRPAAVAAGDRLLADAGVATLNLAVDAWEEVPGGFRKPWSDPQTFRLSDQKAIQYGYTVFLNINICANNMDDVGS